MTSFSNKRYTAQTLPMTCKRVVGLFEFMVASKHRLLDAIFIGDASLDVVRAAGGAKTSLRLSLSRLQSKQRQLSIEYSINLA